MAMKNAKTRKRENAKRETPAQPGYGEQLPPRHASPELAQSVHDPPPVPHSESVVPVWQTVPSQQPAQSVAPHWVRVRQAPPTHDCPFAHWTQSEPAAPQDVGSVPVLQTPPAQHPWQFCGLQATTQRSPLPVSLHEYPGPQSKQSLPSPPQWAASRPPVQHVPSGMQHPLQLEMEQPCPMQMPVEQSPPHVPQAV